MPTIWDSADLLCYNAIDGGCLGNGTTDDSAALQSTINIAAANANGATVILTATQHAYRLSNNVTVPANVALVVFSGAHVSLDAGKTLTCAGPFSGTPELIFVGLGAVTFSSTQQEVFPEWWATNTTPGVTNMAGAIQAAINTAAGTTNVVVRLAATTYALGSTGITILGGVSLIGAGSTSLLTYSGTGSAVTISSAGRVRYAFFAIHTTHDAGTAFEVGTSTRQCELVEVDLQGTGASSTTGTGVFFNSGAGWSGGMKVDTCYALGYKYGYRFASVDAVSNTWTAVTFVNCWAVGRGAGVVSGSKGLSFDANTNGVGTKWIGGTIEAFALGVDCSGGGFGASVFSDFEGNTVDYAVSDTFNGHIENAIGGTNLDQWTNGSANVWYKRELASGHIIEETYYGPRYVVYTGGSASEEVNWYRGASIISGGTPTRMAGFGLGSSPGDYDPSRNFVAVGLNKMGWGGAAPTGGTWAKGDIIFNTGAAHLGYAGWVCTVAGTPGTWLQFGVIA